jgi:hypothetical protein
MIARNAYAVPAKARRNAGAMVHRSPVREDAPDVSRCSHCGTWLDEGDEADLCVNCEAGRTCRTCEWSLVGPDELRQDLLAFGVEAACGHHSNYRRVEFVTPGSTCGRWSARRQAS